MPADLTPPARDDDPGRAAAGRRSGQVAARSTADFELMLALRGAARARDLANRVVRPGSAEARGTAGPGPEDPGAADRPRDLAHPN